MEPFPDTHPDTGSDPDPLGEDSGEAYDEGYYIGVINTADELNWCLGLCFNCGQAGHYWADCTEPLKDSLKVAKERCNQRIQDNPVQQLNPNGGAGGKEARTPQAMPAKAQN